MSANTEGGALVRQVSALENVGLVSHKHCGLHVTVYTLHVRSAKPLQDAHVKKALRLVQRKLQHLRVVVTTVNDKKYFREMPEPKIDFQRIEGCDWHWLHEELLCKKYDMETGPLWCCRLMEISKTSPAAKIGAPSQMPEAYVLMFGYLHAITDGTSNIKMCGHFLRILNDIIAGKKVKVAPIDMFPSLDELLPHESTSYRLSDIIPVSRLLYSFFFPGPNFFTKEFGSPKNTKARTKMIFRELNYKDTQKFIKKCKSSQATFHGAFTVAAALVMRDMVEKSKSGRGDVNFNIGHAVNFRKFIDRDMTDAYGTYIAIMMHTLLLKKDVRENFWEYAKKYTAELHTDLKNGKAFEAKRVIETCLKRPDLFIENQKFHNVCKNEFGTTNIGNIDPHLNIEAEHVEAVAVFRSTAFHYMSITFDHNIQTYKGRLNYNLDYFTNYVTEELATEYADRMMKIILEVSDL